jgi:hypothetical protein
MKPVMQHRGSFIPSTLGRSAMLTVLGTEDMTKFESGVLWRQVKGNGRVCDQATLETGRKYGDQEAEQSSRSFGSIYVRRGKQEALNYISYVDTSSVYLLLSLVRFGITVRKAAERFSGVKLQVDASFFGSRWSEGYVALLVALGDLLPW